MVPVVVLLLTASAAAAELKQKTVDGFERYVRAAESRMSAGLNDQQFLWIDRLPQQNAEARYTELRQGQVYVESLKALENGKLVEIPDGMVHHWIGIVFIPGATLEQTLSVLQNYDNHQKIYAPYVRRSKLLRRDGDDFHIFLQFYRKTVITAVLNVNFDVRYFPVDDARVSSRSYSTRIAEVEDVGEPTEREKPAGTGRGFLWRLCTYGRLLQRDGGVYFQLETIALSRRVPMGLGWLINPLVKRIPRESLAMLLNGTRKAVLSEMSSRVPAVDDAPGRSLPPKQINQFDNQDDHYEKFQNESSRSLKFVRERPIEFLGCMELLVDQALVIRHAHLSRSQPI